MTEQIEHQGLLLTTISEFAGTDWKAVADRIPFANGFDLAAIKQKDSNPFFVTLPVARVGAFSRGKQRLYYGERANQQIVAQVMERQPEGGRGHVPESEIATKYDLPDVMAVGALLEDGTSWVKFYVPPYASDTRDYYRTKMMANAKAAFSLWGKAAADPISNEVIEVDLQRIDMADPSRAGLPVEGVPIVTSHMTDGDDNDAPPDPSGQEDDTMTELTVQLQEMTAAHNRLQAELQAAQTRMAEMSGALGVEQDQIVPTLRALQADAARMAEMASHLGVEPQNAITTVRQLQSDAAVAQQIAEMVHQGEGDPQVDVVVARITEMQTLLAVQAKAERRQKVLGLIDGSREDVEQPLVKLPDLRPVVIANMGAEDTWPQDDAAVTEAVNTILERPDVKKLAEMITQATAGGPAALGATDNGGHTPDPATEEETEKEAEQIASDLGVLR